MNMIELLYDRNLTMEEAMKTDTEDKKYAELEKEVFILRAIYDSAIDQGILACDREGRIIVYNLPSSVYDGMAINQVLGKKFTDVFQEEDMGAIQEVFKTGEPVLNKNLSYCTKDGKRVHQLSSAYPIKKDGEILGAFAITRFHEGIRQLLSKTIELQKQLESRTKKENGSKYTFDRIIGGSKPFQNAIRMAKKAAMSSSPVLVYGETGTGKELFAQSIHNASVYKDSPFIAINCAAIPDTLLESMLFGTKKGAFTGAGDSQGLFEQAKNGTLFLDELNSMPVFLQTKLLRAIQEKTVRRLGGTVDTPICCRIIASCNKPPMECIQNQTLRDDLYYRVSVIGIDIPPLRERREDIILLAESFAQKYAKIYGVPKIEMTEEVKETLLAHKWPGNVRELEHAIESALVMMEPGEKLDVCHLNSYIRDAVYGSKSEITRKASSYTEGSLKEYLAEVEKNAIIDCLEKTDWNISKTAKMIGYTRSNLQYRMQKLGIEHSEE